MDGGDAPRPRRMCAEGGQLLVGQLHDPAKDDLQGRFPFALREQPLDPVQQLGGRGQGVGLDREPAPVEDEAPDARRQRGRTERAQSAVGVAVHVDGRAGNRRDRVDHGANVLELPRDTTRVGVAALGAM
jgi:hypothetical protein